MQPPTCSGLRVRSTADALTIFHAVALNILPMIPRRLDNEERRAIASGSVFVWEERGPHAEATGLGIERWTDGIRWGPSRVRDEFLFYHEKEHEPDVSSDSDTLSPMTRSGPSHGFRRDCLIKQTYSVFVETNRGRRKWHLIAYFTQNSLNYLRSIDDIPQLANLHVPPGKYKSARSAKGRIRERRTSLSLATTSPRDSMTHSHAFLSASSSASHHPQYAPYPADGRSAPPTPRGGHISTTSSSARRSSIQTPWSSYHHQNGPPPDSALTSFSGTSTTHDDLAWRRANHSQSPESAASGNSPILAPLAYLENLTPPHRDPHDEQVLMTFRPRLTI